MASAGTAYVDIRGDFSALNRGIAKTASGAKSKFKAIGKGAAIGFGVGLAGAAVAGKSFLDAQIESEKSSARLRTQLKASGKSYKQYAARIEDVMQAQSRLSGLDDEDLQDSFTNIVRVTGDVNKSLELNAVAADFSRAKNIDVAKAGEIVGKVAGGNIGVLSRYGITLKDGATSAEALAALQKKFSGQAKAYGDTTAGAVDRMGVAWENIKETLGSAIAPTFERIANGAGNIVAEIDNIAKRKDIDFSEKIRLSAKVLQERLQPIATELGQAVERAWPGVQEKAGTLARQAAGAFVRAWLASDWWVKLFTGLYLAKKLGVFRALGGMAAGQFSARFEDYMGKSTRFQSAGKVAGRSFMIGMTLALVAFAPEMTQRFVAELRKELEKKLPGFLKDVPGIGQWLAENNPVSGPLFDDDVQGVKPKSKSKPKRKRPRPPAGSRPAGGIGNDGRRPMAFAAGGMSVTQNIYEAHDPVAVAVQSRRQLERAQRRYSNVNSPRQ